MKAHSNALRNSGRAVSQVNKTIKAAKAIFTYPFDSEYVISNVLQRYPKLQRVGSQPLILVSLRKRSCRRCLQRQRLSS